jgi:hypothetical protein
MLVSEILTELECRGVSLFPEGDRLRFWPKSALTPELLEELKEHKVEVLIKLGEEPVRSASEVLEMAREYFGPSKPFDPSEHPLPRVPGRAPLVRRDTDKAQFFQGNWREAWPQDFKVHERGTQ